MQWFVTTASLTHKNPQSCKSFMALGWIRIMQRLIKGTEDVLKKDPVHDLKSVLKPTVAVL